MVGNKNGYLDRQAYDVLFTGRSEEACPNSLAPTTSTTVQMAKGML